MVHGWCVVTLCEAQLIWGGCLVFVKYLMIDWEDHPCYIRKQYQVHKNTSPRRVAHSSFQQGSSVVTKCSHYAQPKACEGASEEEEGGGLCEPASTTPTHYVSHHHKWSPHTLCDEPALNPEPPRAVSQWEGSLPHRTLSSVHTLLLIDKHAKNTRSDQKFLWKWKFL